MNVDQLIKRLEDNCNGRSRQLNYTHVNKIRDKLMAVGSITNELVQEIVECSKEYSDENVKSSHELILEEWKDRLKDRFDSIYNRSDDSVKSIVKKLEGELFSKYLTKERRDYDYKALKLSIQVMKELRDMIEGQL